VYRAAELVGHALDFWARHAPDRPRFTLTSWDSVQIPQPGDPDWLAPITDAPRDMPTIWVYVNRNPWYMIPWNGRPASGLALATNAMVVLDPRHLPWTADAALTHELGHAIYHLHDYYKDGPCVEVDLMCDDITAYHLDWLGCRSLAALGGACKPQYLPLLEAR
jgi:hypothetical protein